MTLSLKHLDQIEHHWAVQAVPNEVRCAVSRIANKCLVENALGELLKSSQTLNVDLSKVEQVAAAYELVAIERLSLFLSPANSEERQEFIETAQAGAYKAFSLYRVLPLPSNDEKRIFHVLHLSGLAYFGERWTDLRRWLHDIPLATEIPRVEDVDWDKRLLYLIFECWIRLLRKQNWDDLNKVAEIILNLRTDQAKFEKDLLVAKNGIDSAIIAFRLVSLYHLAKATEQLAVYILQGSPVAIKAELDQHFEAAGKAAQNCRDAELEIILRWLHVASRKMVEGSVWWVAQTVNSRVAKFISHVTARKSLFELLPPQRAAISEQGLLDQANRAVVIDLPTSGGKTQLAQFRMLQAINQFAQDDGWVAYVAPTRALVSQITRRLRSDFEPLGIHVEQLTGAIEVDSFEDDLLAEQRGFHVLVATPEKLQLVVRNKKVLRPLALVVMDEAHNIEDEERGLRIELLLATIKQESSTANFLLLMPFVPNARELSQWLAADNGRAIRLGSTAWQPNERIVGMFHAAGYDPDKGENRGDWHLKFETLVTSQRTINLHGLHNVDELRPLSSLNYSNINKSLSSQAVAMAKVFSRRGTSIAVAQTIPHVWNIARKVSAELPAYDSIPDEISLVQRFLATEIAPEFEQIKMLERGVAVHHAGLPSEALSLIEWLTEIGYIRVMCATTTIAQGLNFPVSSVFLATTKFPYGKQMTHRAFWNLAGRAGRLEQNSVGVVGIAAGNNSDSVRQYVRDATGDLISRMETLLDELHSAGQLDNLTRIIGRKEWTDFRSYIAHLWNEKRNLDVVIGESEQTLRNTFGFGALRAKNDPASLLKADALLEAARAYVRELAEHPENAALADATGFSPEGVRTALLEMRNMNKNLTPRDWERTSLFGDVQDSTLPKLMGIMMKIPQLKPALTELAGDGIGYQKLSNITQAWVTGKSLAAIADTFFDDDDFTIKISKACKAVYRDLANNASWGLAALSKMPSAGLDFDSMAEEDRRKINNLPAMLYHGVNTEEGVLMRMKSVPRSVAEAAGIEFKAQFSDKSLVGSQEANRFIKSLSAEDWNRFKPATAKLSGEDYGEIWRRLSGHQ